VPSRPHCWQRGRACEALGGRGGSAGYADEIDRRFVVDVSKISVARELRCIFRGLIPDDFFGSGNANRCARRCCGRSLCWPFAATARAGASSTVTGYTVRDFRARHSGSIGQLLSGAVDIEDSV